MVILIILLMVCSLSSMILSFILTGDSKLADDINKNIPDIIKKNLPFGANMGHKRGYFSGYRAFPKVRI